MTLSMSELEDLKSAALAEGFEWGESRWYEGHVEGEIIVARTDRGTLSDSMREGSVSLRRELTFEVGGREYAVVHDPAFGVLFARVDP